MINSKECSICFEIKSLESFGKHYACKDGRLGQCKNCKSEYGKQWRNKNKSTHVPKKAEYYKNNQEIISRKKKIQRMTNLERFQENNLKFNFDMSLEQYKNISKSQDNVCAICRLPETSKPQNGRTKNLAVDHCHKTGKIRGLLCGKCNKGIGLLQDNEEILMSAISYLKKSKVGN